MSNTEKSKQAQAVDFEKLIETPEFKALVSRKNKFIGTNTVIFMVAFFLLPIFTGYTEVLNGNVVGLINWTWFYSWGLFILTWVLSTIYTRKANSFDVDAKAIIDKYILK